MEKFSSSKQYSSSTKNTEFSCLVEFILKKKRKPRKGRVLNLVFKTKKTCENQFHAIYKLNYKDGIFKK